MQNVISTFNFSTLCTKLSHKEELNGELNGDVHSFHFLTILLFMANFFSKNQNCFLRLKFGTQINLNMENSMVMFFFSILDLFRIVLSKKSIWHFDVT